MKTNKTKILVKVYDELRATDDGSSEWASKWCDALCHLSESIRKVAEAEGAKLPPHLA